MRRQPRLFPVDCAWQLPGLGRSGGALSQEAAPKGQAFGELGEARGRARLAEDLGLGAPAL